MVQKDLIYYNEMTLTEFELLTDIKVISGIMPIMRKGDSRRESYCFRYHDRIMNEERIMTITINDVLNFKSGTGHSVEFMSATYVEDHSRDFVSIDDWKFQLFLQWYWNNYNDFYLHK